MKAMVVCDDGDLAAGIAAARRLGAGLEVQQFYDPVAAEDSAAVEAAARVVAGIRPLSLHGPFGDLCPGSFDAMIREATRHRFELGWAVARRLGAQHLVFHHGYVPGTSPPASWLRRCPAFWREFLADKPASARFHVENMVEHGPELLRDVLDAVAAPNVTACLDIGHAHCHSRDPATRWVEVLGSRIGYVHIHNNHGETDEHLPPDEGTLDVAEAQLALERHCPDAVWAIEVDPVAMDRSVKWVRRRCGVGTGTRGGAA